MNCYPFIEAENAGNHGRGNVKRACELLKVSRSAYYAHRAGVSSPRQLRDTELTGKIVEIHDTSKHTYGSPRVHHELQAQGERCSIDVTSPAIRTTEGIHVGSTLDQLRTAYGSSLHRSASTSNSEVWSVTGATNALAFEFWLPGNYAAERSGVVALMRVGPLSVTQTMLGTDDTAGGC